jgi:type I restriction enzyme R subunit
MTCNEAETRFFLIDPILRKKGYDEHWKLRLETPAPVEPNCPKGRQCRGSGRTSNLLWRDECSGNYFGFCYSLK